MVAAAPTGWDGGLVHMHDVKLERFEDAAHPLQHEHVEADVGHRAVGRYGE